MQQDDSYFRLGESDFGIGKIRFSVDKQAGLLSVEVYGDQELTQRLATNPDGPFGWVLYPPKLYLYAVPYTAASTILTVAVDEYLLDEFDVALYLLEHNDVHGILTIALANNTRIEFEGTAQVDGESIKLSVRCEDRQENS